MDEGIKQTIKTELQIMDAERAKSRPKGMEGAPGGGRQRSLDEELASEASKGAGVKIAETLDEIALWIGIEPDILRATVEEYNSMCDNDYDGLFNKSPKFLRALCIPPYYVIKSYVSFLTTLGGIKINHNIEVLNQQGDPVPGLYAGGDTVGGWQSETYCMYMPGSAFSFAINSGRISGENAAEYVKR